MALSTPNTNLVDYQVANDATSSANTTISAPLPTTRNVGDLMLYIIRSTRNVAAAITAVPTGAQLIAKRDSGATNFPYFWIYRKVIDGTESGSQTFTFATGDTGDDSLEIRMIRGNVDGAAPIGAVSAIVTGTSVSPAAPAIVTTKANSIVLSLVAAINGNRITTVGAGYPSGYTGLIADRTRAFSVGQIYGDAAIAVPSSGTSSGGGTWTNFLNNATTTWAAISIEICASAGSITSINGGAGVMAGSIGNTITFSSSFALTSLTIGSIAATNISGSTTSWTFDLPAQVDNTTSQTYGLKTCTAGNGSINLTASTAFLPAYGYDYETLTNPIDQTIDGVVYEFDPAAAANDQIAAPSETIIGTDASGTTTITGKQILYHFSVSTGKVYTYELITGPVPSPTEIEIGIKTDDISSTENSSGGQTRSAILVDLSGLGSTIPSRHRVTKRQKITGAWIAVGSAVDGVAGTISMAAYVTHPVTNVAGARIGDAWTFPASTYANTWRYVDLDIDLADYVGQYIKPAGGHAAGSFARARGLLVTDSGDSVAVNANCPNPMGATGDSTRLLQMYLVIDTMPAPPSEAGFIEFIEPIGFFS